MNNLKRLKRKLSLRKTKTKKWAQGKNVPWKEVKYTGDGIYNMSDADFNINTYFKFR
jgi:hypothetical protein